MGIKSFIILILEVNVMKLYTVVIYEWAELAGELVPDSPWHPSLMFAIRSQAYNQHNNTSNRNTQNKGNLYSVMLNVIYAECHLC
jgi:hypothetical protein